MRKPLQRAPQNKPFHLLIFGRRLGLLLGLVLSSLGGFAQTFEPIQRHQLPNGLEVGYVQDSSRRLVHLGLTLRGGAALNPKGKAGWANFFERHFWGRPDSSGTTIGDPLAGDGMLSTAGTYLEHFTFTLSLAPDRLGSGMAALAYALRSALAREQQRDRILAEVVNQIEAAEDLPFYYLLEGLHERLWIDAAPRNTTGAYAPLRSLDAAALQAWMGAYLHPGNCLLSATGPGPAEEFFQTADSLLGDWYPQGAGAGLPKLPASRITRNEYFIVENEFAERPLLALAWPLPGGENEADLTRMAQTFAAVARLRAGPFHQALTATGRADALWWEYLPTRNPGYLILRVAPNPDSVPQCLQAIQDQLHAMAQPDWKSGRLLESASHMQALERALAWDRSTVRLDQIGGRWLRMEGEWALDSVRLPAKLPALKAFISRYLDGRPHVAGLLADSYLSQALATSFRPVGPSVAIAPPIRPISPDSPAVALPPALVVDDSAEAAAAELLREIAYMHNIRIYFIGNTMTLDSSTTSQLSDVVFLLRKYPTLKLYINGYADGVGDGYTNYKLSIQRARAVQAAIVAQYKIPENRLILQPFGEAFAEYPDDTPEHRRKNRRVTFEQAPDDAEPRYFID